MRSRPLCHVFVDANKVLTLPFSHLNLYLHALLCKNRGDELNSLVALSREGTTLILDEVGCFLFMSFFTTELGNYGCDS